MSDYDDFTEMTHEELLAYAQRFGLDYAEEREDQDTEKLRELCRDFQHDFITGYYE